MAPVMRTAFSASDKASIRHSIRRNPAPWPSLQRNTEFRQRFDSALRVILNHAVVPDRVRRSKMPSHGQRGVGRSSGEAEEFQMNKKFDAIVVGARCAGSPT